MITHILDTSAILSHYLKQPGWESVQQIFEDTEAKVGVSVITTAEFSLKLKDLGFSVEERDTVVSQYCALIDECCL